MSEIVTKAINYIENTKYVILATTGKDGVPRLRTLASFANDGLKIYFSTGKNTGKVQQIASNPNVSVLVQQEGQEIPSFKSVTLIGKAALLVGGKEHDEAVKLLSSKNPRFREKVEKGLLDDTAIFGIKPDILKFLDFSNGLGADSVKEISLQPG